MSRIKLYLFLVVVASAIISPIPGDKYLVVKLPDNFPAITQGNSSSQGQKCKGRTLTGRRCCTPEKPCGLGEGDCDGPLDGGDHDGHAGCQGDLVCGSNNCQKFGSYFHPKDDCCDVPASLATAKPAIVVPGAPLEPPSDQRCRGRNYPPGRRCCTPENPCGEGEGDCDGAADGGLNDGDKGCQSGLVCGSNNCKKYGNYYHEKDDCCEKPQAPKWREEEKWANRGVRWTNGWMVTKPNWPISKLF